MSLNYTQAAHRIFIALIFVLFVMYGKKAFVWALEEPIYCGEKECK